MAEMSSDNGWLALAWDQQATKTAAKSADDEPAKTAAKKKPAVKK